MRIYVGNLSYQVSDDELRQAFEAFGNVASANVIKDKFSGESRGFGFIEMESDEQAKAAIEGLNGKDLKGRNLLVNEARPKEERPSGGGGGRPHRRGGHRDHRGGGHHRSDRGDGFRKSFDKE